MTKAQLIDEVVEKTNLSKRDAAKAVSAVFDTIVESLAGGDDVQLVGFGTFVVRERAARTGRNLQTGGEICIPARRVPVFRAGKALRGACGAA